MITSVFVTNHHGERYELPLSNYQSSGFIIKNITGINPTKASINTSSGALSPGEFFNSSKIDKRNIVFDFDYYDDGGLIEDKRLLLYKIFEVNTLVDLEIHSDRLKVKTKGYVESHEPTRFVKECGASISVICPDPFLYALAETSFAMTDLIKNFHFTFFNPDPPEELPASTIVFGYYDTNSLKKLTNKGNASGIGFELHALVRGETLTNFVFGNQTRGEAIRLDDQVLNAMVPGGVQNNDEIVISSIRGNKSIVLRRLNQTISILPSKVFNSDWVYLDAGENDLYYTCDEGTSNLDVRLVYTAAYLGV